MKRTAPVLSALLGLALAIAACSSEEAPSAVAAESPSAAEIDATVAPSMSVDADGTDEDSAAVASFDLEGDPELAERFPGMVAGQRLEMISMRGDAFMAGGVDPSFEELLTAVGADLEDVSVAFGGVAVDDGALSVAAFRVAGASQDALEEQFLAATEEEAEIGLSRTTVGGKDVWHAGDPSGQAEAGVFIYVKDDTVYYVTGSEEHAAEIFEALP